HMAAVVPTGAGHWARVLSALLWVALARCYNVDVGRPVVFQGPNGSFFGYSVLQHYHDSTRCPSVTAEPGSLFSWLLQGPACAHRWKNIYYETEYILPHGFCNIIPPNLQPSGKKLLPCYEGKGGGVGAGRASVSGLSFCSFPFMGSYFGSSLCAVDLNSDGLSDLLVGAPMFSEIRDEGQVTVYINRGNGVLDEQLVLDGDGAYNAHFGESIAALGDIDDDGFPDVAIGAPKEDNYIGAVYIYHGDANGIVPQYSMKLSGQTINPMLRMFGQSISGGVDMDGNGYPDMTVGAFLSDHVVLLRSRPVITMDISIFLPASINITAPQCHDSLQPVNCLNVTACFRFSGKHVPGEIGLNYNLTADVAKKEKSQQPRVYFVTSGETVGQITEKLELSYMQEKCRHFLAYVKVSSFLSLSTLEYFFLLFLAVLVNQTACFLRWKKGTKATVFERNCQSDDCAADLKLQGKLLLSSVDDKTAYLALGAVRNISLNISISNIGDDAYDTNVFFNFSGELFFIKMWQKEELGISCELLESDFLKCSVEFPFMRSKSRVILGIYSMFMFSFWHSGNVERMESLHDNTLTLSVPLMHEVDSSINGEVFPTSFFYGDSVEASNFVQLESHECRFQSLNFTLQVYNAGPSTLPGAFLDISFPNRLSATGAEIFHVQQMMFPGLLSITSHFYVLFSPSLCVNNHLLLDTLLDRGS
uniref:Integrin subunit alpha 9 n=1 Tax=Pavo cristatus TaxID=9049 RepID=A0A8C9F807_PAVCR